MCGISFTVQAAAESAKQARNLRWMRRVFAAIFGLVIFVPVLKDSDEFSWDTMLTMLPLTSAAFVLVVAIWLSAGRSKFVEMCTWLIFLFLGSIFIFAGVSNSP
jgi:hypothetical protein